MKKILVIGSGAWGSAIANLLAEKNNQIFITSKEYDILDEINSKHTNQKYLPEVKLNKKITAIKNYQNEISTFDTVFIVVPSKFCADVFKEVAKHRLKKNCGFVICSKGVDQKSLNFLSTLFVNILRNKKYSVLSGPNFAIEIANKVPSITSIASKSSKFGEEVIKLLNNDYFKAIYSPNPLSCEICGAIKNIMAIGCGIIDSLNLGVNTKSALINKGILEIKLLCKTLGVSQNVANPAGFGDIFLTCSSTKSRNNQLGIEIGKGNSYENVVKSKNSTYEGYYSALAIEKMAKKLKIKLNLCESIAKILTKKHSKAEIRALITNVILK